MRRLFVSMIVSLDGYIEGPERELENALHKIVLSRTLETRTTQLGKSVAVLCYEPIAS